MRDMGKEKEAAKKRKNICLRNERREKRVEIILLPFIKTDSLFVEVQRSDDNDDESASGDDLQRARYKQHWEMRSTRGRMKWDAVNCEWRLEATRLFRVSSQSRYEHLSKFSSFLCIFHFSVMIIYCMLCCCFSTSEGAN